MKKKRPTPEWGESENKQMKRREVSEVREDKNTHDAAGSEMWQGMGGGGFLPVAVGRHAKAQGVQGSLSNHPANTASAVERIRRFILYPTERCHYAYILKQL